jgi:hypothetical protein
MSPKRILGLPILAGAAALASVMAIGPQPAIAAVAPNGAADVLLARGGGGFAGGGFRGGGFHGGGFHGGGFYGGGFHPGHGFPHYGGYSPGFAYSYGFFPGYSYACPYLAYPYAYCGYP